MFQKGSKLKHLTQDVIILLRDDHEVLKLEGGCNFYCHKHPTRQDTKTRNAEKRQTKCLTREINVQRHVQSSPPKFVIGVRFVTFVSELPSYHPSQIFNLQSSTTFNRQLS